MLVMTELAWCGAVPRTGLLINEGEILFRACAFRNNTNQGEWRTP